MYLYNKKKWKDTVIGSVIVDFRFVSKYNVKPLGTNLEVEIVVQHK